VKAKWAVVHTDNEKEEIWVFGGLKQAEKFYAIKMAELDMEPFDYAGYPRSFRRRHADSQLNGQLFLARISQGEREES
jgi:hypothetical protein